MLNIAINNGEVFDLANPDPTKIDFREIAYTLAKINRFCGRTPLPYSVAQHSVIVAQILELKNQPTNVILAGLLHDAHEAFTGDIITPIKSILNADKLHEVQSGIDEVIYSKTSIHLSDNDKVSIKEADNIALATELRDLLEYTDNNSSYKPLPFIIKPVPWLIAAEEFIRFFNKYYKEAI